jgi:hypothetical protein
MPNLTEDIFQIGQKFFLKQKLPVAIEFYPVLSKVHPILSEFYPNFI